MPASPDNLNPDDLHDDQPRLSVAAISTEEQPPQAVPEQHVSSDQPNFSAAAISTEGQPPPAEVKQSLKPPLPYPPTEENIPLLEQWLKDTFHTVFDTEQYPLPVLKG